MSFRLARMAAIAALAMAATAATAQAATPSAYVYATGSEQMARQYAADDAGALAPLTPAGVDAGTASKGAVATPDGRYLYVSNESSDDISQYAIAASPSATAVTRWPSRSNERVSISRSGSSSSTTRMSSAEDGCTLPR